MCDMTEYEYTLPDGQKRYEFVSCVQDHNSFMQLHNAVSGMPLKVAEAHAAAMKDNPDPED